MTNTTHIQEKRKAYKAKMDALIQMRTYAPELLEALQTAQKLIRAHATCEPKTACLLAVLDITITNAITLATKE